MYNNTAIYIFNRLVRLAILFFILYLIFTNFGTFLMILGIIFVVIAFSIYNFRKKMQTNSFKWMLFAIFFPIGLGIVSSAIIFTLGNMYSWSGFEAMTYYYIVVLLITLILGLYPNKSINWKGGLKNS